MPDNDAAQYHPRCDCHACVQAEIAAGRRVGEIRFSLPVCDCRTCLQARDAERARCAKIANDVGYRLYAEGRGEETMGPVREIAEKIRSGE